MLYIAYIFKSLLLFLLFIPSLAQAKLAKSEQNSLTTPSLSKNQPNQLIILFHGLNNDAASFDTMKKRLEQYCPDAAVVVPTSVEGMQSVVFSINEQAKMVFKELSNKIDHLEDTSILLVGHSQGGPRAYAFLKQYEHCLHIKGLVTIAAPWEGAPGARVDPEMLSQHLTAPVLDDLRKLSLCLGYGENELEERLRFNVQANQEACLFPGAKDLMEGSLFLAEVKRLLADEKLLILAIGGGQGDFGALLTKKGGYRFKALNEIYTFFVAGDKYAHGRHDMQLPLYSQHALNIFPKKKNFKRVFIKDAFHSTHVLSIPVPKSKDILSHPRVFDEVIKFARKYR